MSKTPKVTNPHIELNLSHLGLAGRVTLLAVIAKFAPKSTQYTSNPAYAAAVDKAVAHGPTLTTSDTTADTAKKAAQQAITARDTEIAATDRDLNVLKALAETLFLTEADFQNNGFNRRIRKPSVALMPPEVVNATPAKKVKGLLVHAVKLAGLFKYICAISTDAASTGTYTVLNGTSAKRTVTGLVSGQGYWIKFCTERGQNRSAWSTPVYCVAS